ncbi:nitronate monooxygenase family protein [Novosphingobium sp. AP12]|uniref:NAD(P)H-dependent flavin oxidoreductase n=1 Tax=Novosphingobium sp. AP12 TaxID=1144305 RepID=UPI000271F14E|nr:nitronate monooxygenase [Novosphingobium sp. AP12]EJL31150.1 2-nitropropane dioxygenase-like enzyme [Novosphingobium sp. AP12]
MALAASIRDRLTLPAFCAPMFLCSTPALAAACCKAGIVGSLTANHCRDLEGFVAQLREVGEALAAWAGEGHAALPGPLAVNLAPSMDTALFREHLAAAKAHGARIVVTSVGNPVAVGPMIRDHGLLHFHDVTNLRFAEKAAQAGVDGMIAIGAGGGGHSGTISHLAFIPQIRAIFDGTVVMAGAVTTGAGIRAAELLGADLAYMGTRFIATREAGAPDAYKAMLVAGGVEDVIYTRGVNGLPAMWLKTSLREAGLDPDALFIPEGRSTDHLPPDRTPWRDIWSGGQGIGLIHDAPPVADLVRTLRAEYLAACALPDMAEAAQAAQDSGR